MSTPRNERPQHTIDLGEFDEDYAGKEAHIIKRLSWAERQRIDGAGGKVRQRPKREESKAGLLPEQVLEVDLMERSLTILETTLVDWDLEIPITRAGFRSDDFEDDLGDWLVETIEEHYEATSRRKTRGSSPSSSGSTESSSEEPAEAIPTA